MEYADSFHGAGSHHVNRPATIADLDNPVRASYAAASAEVDLGSGSGVAYVLLRSEEVKSSVDIDGRLDLPDAQRSRAAAVLDGQRGGEGTADHFDCAEDVPPAVGVEHVDGAAVATVRDG